MAAIVVPFDGSASAVRAVDFVVDKLAKANGSPLSVHVVNVQAAGAGIAGLMVRDAADVSAGEELDLRFHRGRARARVTDTTPSEEDS